MAVNEALIKQYVDLLKKLLPQGKAWQFSDNSNFNHFITAEVTELARVHERLNDLVQEAFPLSADELLPEWEKLAGLPNECSGLEDTIQERRNAVVFELVGLRGCNPADFNAIFKSIGIDATVTEIHPFICGYSHLGRDALNGVETNRYYFIVNIHSKNVEWFTCNVTEIGLHPLAKIAYMSSFECFVNRIKPANTIAIFGYT